VRRSENVLALARDPQAVDVPREQRHPKLDFELVDAASKRVE
jgi:hypothetical protein